MKRREFHDQSGIEGSPIAAFLLTCCWTTKPKKVFLSHRGSLPLGDGILKGERVMRKAIGDLSPRRRGLLAKPRISTPRTPFGMTAFWIQALSAKAPHRRRLNRSQSCLK